MANNLNNKYMVQRHRKELEDSLTFDDVRDKLYAKFVLTNKDLSSIDELDSNNLKVSACLDIILEKNDHLALDNFINSLNEIDLEVCSDMYKKLTNPKGLKRMKQEEGNLSIARGGVPRTCESYINRKEEKDLEKLLSNQELNDIIVLMGFPLVGKTNLASHVLRNPDLIFDRFKNKIFWLDLHDATENDPSSIADHLKRLIGSITEFDNSFDSQRELSLAWYKDLLRSKFLLHCNGGLLVLDNVHSRGVLKHFDVGCKMLVIANNRAWAIKHASKKIELGNFTEDETTACLASALPLDLCLNIRQNVERIPIVRRVHQCLEGHPKLVGLVATYLKEGQADKWNNKRWEDMLSRLLKEGDVSGRRDSQFGILQKPLKHITSMLLELLSEDQQNYFKQLVIMPDHVNISPEVLSVYWGIPDLYDVEDILNRFHKLSLLERTITNEFDESKFIYGLRNLLLKCLKSIIDEDFLVHCHRKLLKAYHDKYGDVAMLPNDNYIYSYYGYHLDGAKAGPEGFSVFLNLRFICAKIKYCGVGEMLRDLRMYRGYIIRNHPEENLDAYMSFLEKCETNLLKNGLDLVQYALRITDNHQIVFNDALHIARNSSKLYLTWAFKNEPHFTRTLDLHNRFETVLFANDPKFILVGTKTGDIQLWDLDSRLMILKYVGHTKGIKQLKLSPCKKYFLSTSHDMTFKIWKMNNQTSHSRKESEPLSPSLRQRGHHSFFADESSLGAVGDSYSTAPNITATSATFYEKNGPGQDNNTLSMVTCSPNGELVQWMFREEDHIFPLQLQGQLLVASNSAKFHTFDIITSGKLLLFVYSQADKQLFVVNPHLDDDKGNNYVIIMALPDSNSHDAKIHQILAVNDELCVAIGGNIHILRFKYVLRKGILVYEHYNKFELPLQSGSLSCASLTENASYLVTGTVDGFILLWDLQLLRVVKEFTTNNRLVIGLDTFTTPDSITLLLSGSDDSTVKCWHIASEHLAHHSDVTSVCRSASSSVMMTQQSEQRQKFSCYWPGDFSGSVSGYRNEAHGMETPIVALLDEDNNAIQIYSVSQLHTDQLLCTVDLPLPSRATDENDEDVTLFQLDGNALYYVLRGGAVRRYHLRTGADELLWYCKADNLGDRHVVNIMCLGDNGVIVGCNRNSLTLLQCTEGTSPVVSVLLDPSALDDDVVRIFHLQNVNVRVRVMRLLIANSNYVYVLCTENTSVQNSRGASNESWVESKYRMEPLQGETYAGDIRITDCLLSSDESHLVLFLSNGQCDILKLETDGRELSYVSEYIFQPDQNMKITASAISFDGQLLALGKENGDIEVIDVSNHNTKMVLKQHNLQIETLLFSPKPNYVLVSAAEGICWWKLQEFAEAFGNNTNQIALLSLGNKQVWKFKQPAISHSIQLSATGESSKYLLRSISLPGPLKNVTASKDFTSFITLDSLGIMHSFSIIA